MSKSSNSLNAMIKRSSVNGKQWKPKRHIIAAISATFLITTLLGSAFTVGALASQGNPVPGVPHDTLIFHVQKSGPEECSGGHSAHIQANIIKNEVTGAFPEVQLLFTMIDWVDPAGDPDSSDGIGNDVAYQTKFLDCTTFDEPFPTDMNDPPTLELQIGDKDPRKGWISTQSFFLRSVGIPDQAVGMITSNGFYFSCVIVDDMGDDDPTNDVIDCTVKSGPVPLADVELTSDCVHKTKGKGGGNTGKVNFCNVTESFLVDVDGDGDGNFTCVDPDACGIHIFQVGCIDDPATTQIVEECPLGSAVWGFDDSSERFTLQMFVAHDGNGKITKAGPGKVRGHV